VFASVFWKLRTRAFELIKRSIRLRFPTVPSITPDELEQWLKSSTQPQPILIDVRSTLEFSVSHLQTARSIDLTSAHEDFAGMFPKESPIVVYCSVGYRSAKFAQRLQQQGYSNVFNLEGSIFQWVNEERPVYSNDHVTTIVHPYNKLWGTLLDPDHRSGVH
jgi:rhodanese-related sulfurtransferase